MLKKLRNRIKGQSTAEYAMLLALVVGAVALMGRYVARGINAGQRDAVLYMANQAKEGAGAGPGFAGTVQYEPYYASSDYTTNRDGGDSIFLIGNQQIGGAGSVYNSSTSRTGNSETSYNRADMTNTDL